MVVSLGVPSGFSISRIISKIDGGFAVYTQTLDPDFPFAVFGFDVLKDFVCLWDFFGALF
jgi:hypothetical protein